ncbi:MAG: hypothetical protein OXJ52_10095 [Oligoflexia bacterium]|nr:hypothetical protein [Oligoflexia bacterium]
MILRSSLDRAHSPFLLKGGSFLWDIVLRGQRVTNITEKGC